MIDEDLLRDLMAEAASAVPAPGRAPDALLDALAAEPTNRAQRVFRRRLAVPLTAAAVLLAVVVGSGLVTSGSRTEDTFSTASAGADASHKSDESLKDNASGSAAPESGSGESARSVAPAAEKAKVVKTGSIDLEIRKGAFEATIERITSLAIGMGGYIAESTTTESDTVPRGGVTVRVPAASFDQLLTELRRLGDVNAVTSKGTDVTAQFTDLDARHAALSATRDRLYEVLRGAGNVGDIIAVQDRITAVQTEIEQIKGQQRLLTDQTSFGTLAVTLAEPGAREVRAGEPGDGLGAAWREARRRFGNAIEGLIEWSGTASVVALVTLLVGALAWLTWTRGRRRLV